MNTQSYRHMWSCQLPSRSAHSRGNIFSSLSEDKPPGSCCRALQRKYIKKKTASLKSFQSAPLSLLVEFELHKAEFGPSKSKKPDHLALQAASISRSRCFKILYFFINSYNNWIKKASLGFCPGCGPMQKHSTLLCFQRASCVPGLSERRAAR